MKISSKTKKWLKCAGIRAAPTVAQTPVAAIGTATVFAQVDTVMSISTALLAGVVSLLTSIAGLPECKEESDE